MHDLQLALAALPEPTEVLGLSLRPYALGHELFLIREQNPLATIRTMGEAAAVRMPDLAQAVLICSSSVAECRRMHRSWLLPWKLRLWKARARKANLGPELAAFIDYRLAGSLAFPPSNNIRADASSQPPRSLGSPFLLRLHQFLVMRLNLSEAAAWEYPYGLAKMNWQAFWEQEGGLDIYNEEDEITDAFVAEQEALAAQKGGK